ncbi:MAG: hypothetical protein CVV64_10375 [Candidatus Wallbacteria bacterium HGW-Wallbacteria-1]|jgi:hypothetical protein|uniref:RES domain-containing protein n=1 Tax=Candidatus Wallbacteria bacterium HGW-Wallbacteria-1 TaxID=2013854 RepID=A0A2N1PPU1_9BACT|nr:MAG: hypothetical protein CVV64_10375 [Candidatus Wallbacteria bacterium HGW-Wallbacteria-1]
MDTCCENCFTDLWLKKYIKTNGELLKDEECNFCLSTDCHCIKANVLAKIFSPLINLYDPVNDVTTNDEENIFGNEFIWAAVKREWCIFSAQVDPEQLLKSIFSHEWYDSKGAHSLYYDTPVFNKDNFYGISYAENHNFEKHWNHFCNEIKHSNRYFIDSFDENMITILVKHLSIILKKNNKFYRARSTQNQKFDITEMGMPPETMATQTNRMNPPGIPYLYMASTPSTAISEMRPSLHEKFTIGIFALNKNIKIIDFCNYSINSPFSYGNDLAKALIANEIIYNWSTIISIPIAEEKGCIDYVPIQFIAEYFKKKGSTV